MSARTEYRTVSGAASSGGAARARTLASALSLILALQAFPSPWPAGGTLQAQEDPGAGRLTLQEALELAERHNPGYRRSTNSLELNAIEQRDAWLSLLPRPTLSVLTTTMNWNLTRVGTDIFGNPLPNPEDRMIQSSTSNQRASLNTAMDFGRIVDFRRRGDDGIRREMEVAEQLHRLRADVRLSFLNVQQRQLALDLEIQHLERQGQKYEVARRLYALAERQPLDVLEAELDVEVQEEALRQARSTLSSQILQLRNFIGDPGLEILGVEPLPFRDFDPAALDDEALVREALASSPAVALQQANIRSAEQQRSRARLQPWLPTLSINLSTARSEAERGGSGAFFQPNPAGGWDRNIGFSVGFPDVARYFDAQNTNARRELDLRNAQETLRERRLQVDQQVRATLADLRSAYAAVALQTRRVELFEMRLEDRLEGYRLGRATFQDLQNASEALANAERALLQSRYTLEGAVTTLEQTLGMSLDRIVRLGGS